MQLVELKILSSSTNLIKVNIIKYSSKNKILPHTLQNSLKKYTIEWPSDFDFRKF